MERYPEVNLASAIRELAMACAEAGRADKDGYFIPIAITRIDEAVEKIAEAKAILINMQKVEAA